jgi:hypothetical protein
MMISVPWQLRSSETAVQAEERAAVARSAE